MGRGVCKICDPPVGRFNFTPFLADESERELSHTTINCEELSFCVSELELRCNIHRRSNSSFSFGWNSNICPLDCVHNRTQSN